MTARLTGRFSIKDYKMTATAQQKESSISIDLQIRLKEELPPGESLYITGNSPTLGNWEPAGKKLEKDHDDIYCVSLTATKGSIIEYKLTRGSWKTQGICDPKVIPPENMVIKATRNTSIKVTILDWLDRQVLESDPVRGRLLEFDGFPCSGLKHKRPIQVWLPDSYSEDGPANSVIYMHDSQNLFEPASAFAGVDWKVDENISDLLESGVIRPCIVVGIPNSPDRMKELNLFTREGKAYAKFIVDEVIPFVEKRFNVIKSRSGRALMGSSMGGLMSLQMLLDHPQVFSLAGCLSSAFQKTDGKIFAQIEQAASLPLDTRIYLDTGEFEPPIAASYVQMMNLLKMRGFCEGKNLMGFFDEAATHCEAAWARRLKLPLQFLLGKN